MKSGQDSRGHVPEQWEVQIVYMEMKDIELLRLAPHPVEHEHIVGNDITDFRVQPQSCWNAAYEFRRGYRIAAGE